MAFWKKKEPQSNDDPKADAGAKSALELAREESPSHADPRTTEEPKKKGIFARLKKSLKKTSNFMNRDIRDLFKKEGRLVDDDFLKEVFAILIKTDMGVSAAGQVRDGLKAEFYSRVVQREDLLESAQATIREIMQQPDEPIVYADSGPTVIMVVGVNGSGKTTSIAKLAYMFRQSGKSVVMGAGDTFRAAAVDQLKIWAGRVGAEIVTANKAGEDPASVAYRTVARGVELNADICIVDTAGRLQTQTNLMQELSKVRNVAAKVIPEAPHEVLLVLDATAGQNGLSQARGFSDAAGCTGIVLAKLDGTAKGGVAIPIRQEFNLPVKYIGIGEQAEDLALFNVDQYVAALFDDEAA